MQNHEYAGFWVRLWAALIDSFILFMFFFFLGFSMGFLDFELSQKLSQNTLFNLAVNSVFLLFSIIFWIKMDGKTPGKKVMKIKIVDEMTFENISVKQSIIRAFSYILSSILLIGYIMVAFTEKKQGLHDKLAGTVVIYEDNESII